MAKESVKFGESVDMNLADKRPFRVIRIVWTNNDGKMAGEWQERKVCGMR
jgi:hypothetical protein